jgi:hypothetical protein
VKEENQFGIRKTEERRYLKRKTIWKRSGKTTLKASDMTYVKTVGLLDSDALASTTPVSDEVCRLLLSLPRRERLRLRHRRGELPPSNRITQPFL